MTQKRKYSVIGLGKLGGSMAAAIASRGFEVVGVDVSQAAVSRVNAGHAPVQETGLEELVAANHERLRATTAHRDAILNSDATFVIVPTPSDEYGAFSLQYSTWAFAEIGRALREKTGYHLVTLTSTVLPGSTRSVLLPMLEEQSGKKCGRDFGLCYSPEFIALGSVIRDFLNPDFTLVGESDARAGALLEECYREILANNAPCRRMSIENAELTKIALNTFVTTKITFANMLADLCERIPGGDVDVVTGALGLDRRVGAKYLRGALGYGGPCFPRDNVALTFLAGVLGVNVPIAEATDRYNRALASKIAERVRPWLKRNATVAILGLAYKPHSHVVEESQGIFMAQAFSRAGQRVVAYDPLACESARAELHGQIVILESMDECLQQADAVVITNPDPLFQQLTAERLLAGKSSVTVVDCWRLLDRSVAQTPGIRYIPIGRSINDAENAARLTDLWIKKMAAGANSQ